MANANDDAVKECSLPPEDMALNSLAPEKATAAPNEGGTPSVKGTAYDVYVFVDDFLTIEFFVAQSIFC